MSSPAGTTVYEESWGMRRVHYKFFDDPENEGRDAGFSLDEPLEHLVNALKSASKGYGIEKRVLLLHGPVGSSKSTIARLLKRGLERYSTADGGAVYTLGWINEDTGDVNWCPMHEEPLHVIPERFRDDVLTRLNAGRDDEERKVRIIGELCPYCRFMYSERLKKYSGDWTKVVQDIRVKRVVLSEQDRLGIGTFQPKDEKNQDSTELTGDINYRKIAEYGSDSDPRAFNFDGEFNVANRGIIEFIEVLKLDVAFLYDLLGASQEHKVKPKKFAQTDIDEVILGHTNEPEYRRLQDKLSNALVAHLESRSINPFMVMNELDSGLKHHSLITSEETKQRYRDLLSVVKEEYENIVKNEVQRAIAADEDALKRLCANYIDNVKAYTQREKVRNKFTGQFEEPDERLMRSIEEKIDIPDSRKDDFHRETMNYIAALMMDGKTFDYKSNERLYKALQLKLFEDQKDTIKLTSLVSQVVDKDTQAKIDVVKSRLIRDFGYDDESATDVLNYVAGIFAPGDVKTK